LSFHAAGLAAITSGEMDFIGLDNYVTVFTDPLYRRVALTTIVFGLACVAATMVLGVASALLLNRPFWGRGLLAVAVLLPWAMPRIAAAIVWRWLFDDQYGLVNWTLAAVGIDGALGFAWFNDRLTAFAAIGVVVVWQSFPFIALSVLAGLQSISQDVLDAARLDGAGAWQRLRLVILPLLKPLLLVLVVISTIWDFKIFDQVFAMTNGGGPARSTEVLSITVYREAFTRLDFGLGSALAMVMFLILLAFTVAYIRLIRDEEEVA
ncbi:MAG: carbohydrate ABC transporter permease, partial [Dehalococcoidia bacterium]